MRSAMARMAGSSEPESSVIAADCSTCRSSRRSAAPSSGSRAGITQRTSHGRVPPWISSEPIATRKAMKTSSERLGVSEGRVCAAASVTTPRMPAQTTTVPSRQPSRSSR